jgi:hypothetical protein
MKQMSHVLVVEDELKAESIRNLDPSINVKVISNSIAKIAGFQDNGQLKYVIRDMFFFRKEFIYFFAMSFTPQGEKMVFDLYNYLDIPLTQKRRIRIKRYTQEGLAEALESPLSVDETKVENFICKETKDYTFAFQVSPWLWSQISNSYEKNITMNESQYNLLNQPKPVIRYVLKAYFSKHQICFYKMLDSFEEVQALAKKLIETPFTIMKQKKEKEEEELLDKKPLLLSTEEMAESMKRLLYDGYIDDEYNVIQESVEDATLNKNDRLLYNYLIQTTSSKQSSSSNWVCKNDNNDILFHYSRKPSEDGYLQFFKSNIVWNMIETCVEVVEETKMELIEKFEQWDELRRMEYKGYVRLSNDQKLLKREVPLYSYSKTTGLEEISVKEISVKKSIIQPLGYMVYNFFKDNYENFPENRFDIPLDDANVYTCIIAKFGLVVRRVDPSTGDISFLKLRDSFDHEALYAGKYKNRVEDLIKEGGPKVSSSPSPLSRFIDGKRMTLKKGQYGIYLEILKDQTRKTISLKEFGNCSLESIRWEEVLKKIKR